MTSHYENLCMMAATIFANHPNRDVNPTQARSDSIRDAYKIATKIGEDVSEQKIKVEKKGQNWPLLGEFGTIKWVRDD